MYRRTGPGRAAEAAFRWGIAGFARAGNPPEEITAHIGMGNLALKAGQPDAAEESYRRARVLAQRHGAAAAVLYPNVLACLAEVHAARGEYATALAHYDEALALARELDERTQQARIRFQIALVHRRAGNAPAAIEAAQSSADLFDLLGLPKSADRARALTVQPGEQQGTQPRIVGLTSGTAAGSKRD